MESNPEDIDLIERYLLGKLTEEETEAFGARLAGDREFARKFRLRKTFPDFLQEPAREELEKIRAEVEEDTLQPKPSALTRKVKRLIPLFVLLLAAFVFLLLFFSHGPALVRVPADEQRPAQDSQQVSNGKQAPVKTVKEASGQAGPDGIVLLTPADGVTLSRWEQIQFTWKQETDTLTNFYIFSEDPEKQLFWRGIRPGIREYTVPAIYFKPGNYFWYVGNRSVKQSFVISE